MSLEQLNAELRNLRIRQRAAGSSVAGKLFGKEISLIERIRLQRFGIAPRQA
jgi:hypothetical protein